MHQKYTIDQDADSGTLTIREYAVVDKDTRKEPIAGYRDGDFSLLAEETYDSERLSKSIARGDVADLVTALRTDNLFPISPHVTKIAESIIEMCRSPEWHSLELIFDDQNSQ
jgi:hypothetical protein